MPQVQKLSPEDRIEIEIKQSMIMHELMKGIWEVDFISPIEQELTQRKDFKVLDVGCGASGTWLLQLSKDYPLAKFIGLDKSPILPKDFSQDNLQFIQCDILKGIPFEDDSFDFVNAGFLQTEFTEEQWEKDVIKELIRVCKPGGWIELSNFDEIKSLSPTSKRLITLVMNYLDSKGISVVCDDDVPEIFYSNDQLCKFRADERLIPIGNWGGDLGKLALEWFITTFQQMSESSIQSGISKKEYETMIKQYVKDVEHYHSYFISLRACCQKSFKRKQT